MTDHATTTTTTTTTTTNNNNNNYIVLMQNDVCRLQYNNVTQCYHMILIIKPTRSTNF